MDPLPRHLSQSEAQLVCAILVILFDPGHRHAIRERDPKAYEQLWASVENTTGLSESAIRTAMILYPSQFREALGMHEPGVT